MLPYVCWAMGASSSSFYLVLLKGVRAAAGTGKDAELLFASTACLKRAKPASRVYPGNWAAVAPLCLGFRTWKGYRCLQGAARCSCPGHWEQILQLFEWFP